MDEEKELHTQINRPRALNFKQRNRPSDGLAAAAPAHFHKLALRDLPP